MVDAAGPIAWYYPAGVDLGISGRRALVSGSSLGLGLATARALAEAGCQVVISGRDEDRLAVADLPERWWQGMQSLLGVEPTEDARGVLQDVHWSYGAIGYFPTYALGTLLSVQLYEAALADDPSIQPALQSADFSPLLAWMRQHVHRHGSAWTAAELVALELDAELSAEPFLDYLENKYRTLYGL